MLFCVSAPTLSRSDIEGQRSNRKRRATGQRLLTSMSISPRERRCGRSSTNPGREKVCQGRISILIVRESAAAIMRKRGIAGMRFAH